jgi:FAD/FMN-containing dehydrogenase
MGGCGDVGVAGLALAGGDTFAMGTHGTACDNLLSAQVVTAEGAVLEVGPGSHEDLFWALRGGGGNFGVVTRLDFQLHPVRPTTSAYWEILLQGAAGAIRAVRELLQVAPDEVGAGFGLGPQSSAWVYCGFLGEGVDAERTLAAWQRALRPVEPRTRTSLPDAKGVVLPPGSSAHAAVFVHGLSDPLIEVLVEHAGRAPHDASIYAVASRGAVSRVAVGDTAYPLRQPGFHISAEAPWTQAADRVAAEEWTARFETAMHPFSRLAYVNYLGVSSVDRVRDAYGPNYERLARIKGRYDPANRFRSNHNILPAG